MYNGIKNVSAYKCLPSELTKKVKINRVYKNARFRSVAGKAWFGAYGLTSIAECFAGNYNYAILCAVLSVFSRLVLANKNSGVIHNNFKEAYKEIVARAKHIKKLLLEDMAKSPI